MATVPIPRRRPLASMRHDPSAMWHHVDAALVGLLLAVAGLGVLMVYSATRGAAPPYDAFFLTRQSFFVVLPGG